MMQPIVIGEFGTRQRIALTPQIASSINQLVVTEYMQEFSAGTRHSNYSGNYGTNTGTNPW